MEPYVEIDSTRSLAGALGGTVWGWEVPVYLFLGGLTAGLMIMIGVLVLLRGRGRITEGMRWGIVLAPISLSLGMLALFIDLSYKAHVFRFYTTIQPAAPMSLGSWILLLVNPILALLFLAMPPRMLAPFLELPDVLSRLCGFARRSLPALAWASIAGGAALGLYTGFLLALTVAHPLWSSSVLGLLFLTSGFVAGVSVLALLETEEAARTLFTRIPAYAIAVELVLIGSWLIAPLTQGPLAREAAGVLLWGSYAPVFLGFVLFGGMIVPALLEILALRGAAAHSRVAPALALAGGFLLRVVIVSAGQVVGFPAA